MALPFPVGWERDEVSNFLETCRANVFASFVKTRPDYDRLVGIDGAYRRIRENLLNTEEWFSAFFMLRAHSAFLAAVSLSLAGQVPETYAILRTCLEYSLYGHYLARNPASRETWLRRHDDAASKQKVRDEFTIRRLLDTLETSDAQAARIASSLYDQTIDYGAHPNEQALSSSLRMDRGVDRVEFQVIYVQGGTLPQQLAVKSTARVGVCSIDVFRIVYMDRFRILGLVEALDQLKQGL